MKVKKLDPHAGLIRQMVRDGAKNGRIRKALLAFLPEVGLETVRAWVNADPAIAAWKKAEKGRPISKFPPLIRFLPAHPAAPGTAIEYPSLFQVFLNSGIHDEELRMANLAGVIKTMGIYVPQDRPIEEWVIPASILSDLRDLEICFLVLLLDGMPTSSVCRRDDLFMDWLRILTLRSGRLKRKINEGGDLAIGELVCALR